MKGRSGLALVAVLLVLTVIGLTAFAAAFQARLGGILAVRRQHAAVAEGHAFAGLELAFAVLEAGGGTLPSSLLLPEAPDLRVELVDYRLLDPDSAVVVLRGDAAGGRGSFLLEAGIDDLGSELVVSWIR